jgi:hypothetical protein
MDLYIDETKSGTYPQGGILTDQVVSMYDITKPQHYPTLVARYGNQYENFFTFFQNMGRLEATPNDEYYAWEENWIHETCKVTTGGTSSGGSLDVEVDADAEYGTTNIYPRVGDILTLPDERQVYISNKSESGGTYTLTLKEVRDYHGDFTISNGDELAITSGAFPYGGSQPEGAIVGHTPRAFQAQLIKEDVQLEGQEFTREKWLKVAQGKDYDYWYTTGLGSAEYRLGLKWDGAVLLGMQDDGNLTSDATYDSYATSKTVKTTMGMIPTIRNLGKTIETQGTFAVDYLDQSAMHMKRNGATTNVALAVMGNLFYQSLEDEMMDNFLASTNIDYTRVQNTLFGGNQELSASMNIKYITKGGITWMIHPHDNFSNPKGLGLSGYTFEQMAILLPWGTTKDKKTGMKTTTIGMKYLAANGYSRKLETWTTAGAGGGRYVHSVDRAEMHLRSHMMFYMLAANQAILLDPNTADVSISI